MSREVRSGPRRERRTRLGKISKEKEKKEKKNEKEKEKKKRAMPLDVESARKKNLPTGHQ